MKKSPEFLNGPHDFLMDLRSHHVIKEHVYACRVIYHYNALNIITLFSSTHLDYLT